MKHLKSIKELNESQERKKQYTVVSQDSDYKWGIEDDFYADDEDDAIEQGRELAKKYGDKRQMFKAFLSNSAELEEFMDSQDFIDDPEDDDLEYSTTQSNRPSFDERNNLIDIPKVPQPEFVCTKEITFMDQYHKPIHIKPKDKIILDNYLYDKGNYGRKFIVTSVNGKKVEFWISIEELTDNFKL
jgi:hypothetical protein